MKLLDRPEVLAWWTLSRSDWRVAHVVAELNPPEWHLVCFLAQQAAEKALKALLEARDLPVPRTHDLRVIAERLGAGHDAEAVIEAAILLSVYGVGPRYPSVTGEATAEQARAALDAARVVCDWADEALRT
jgi:HEPN domain-containing protein